ncbi:MAG: hypothetical protein II778_09465, partial [Anaerovibrio sp.]|nr:hypothetical protein [Anaerovibrio sp.]
PLNSKVKIDIKYNDVDSTATCIYTSSIQYKFLCTPDIETQEEDDYFEISKTKKEGTVTFSYKKRWGTS